MVHGLTAYIVACGPRTKGSRPGSVSAAARPARSAAVYSGLTTSESGVCQFSESSGAPRSDSRAAAFQASKSVNHVSRVPLESDISFLVPAPRRSQPDEFIGLGRLSGSRGPMACSLHLSRL